MKHFLSIILYFILTAQLAESLVTDEDYARLPPVFEFDNFDRCMSLKNEALYCFTEFKISPIDISNVSKTWTDIQELNRSPKNYEHDRLRHGICVPFQCPEIKIQHTDEIFKEQLERCLSQNYENVGLDSKIEEMSCQTSTSEPFDIFDFLTVAMLVLYVVFVIFASIYEGSARYKSPEEYIKITGTSYGKILKSFSIPNNWYRLIRSDDSPDAVALRPIQGIRVYSMILVIWSHAAMIVTGGFSSNTRFTEKIFDTFLTLILSSGIYCVAIFFLISAWLLSYKIFKTFNKNSGRELDIKTVMIIIINRYIRLTIPLLVSILVQISIIPQISSGPLWDVVIGEERQRCRKNMWTNLLYINNLVNTSEMCFSESWHLAVDMQGFILGILLLYFVVKKPKRIWWLIPSVLVINQAILARRLYKNKIYNAMSPYPEKLYLLRGIYENENWINYTANSNTYFAVSLIGLITGYIFFQYGNKSLIAHKVASSKIAAIGWWATSFGLAFSTIILPGLWIFSEHYQPSFWFSIPYLIGSPIIFGIAIAIGFLGFSEGVGGITYWAVTWKPLNILGKLTYSTFLAHYSLTLAKYGRISSSVHADELAVLGETMSIAACSLFFGLIISLFIELPLSALQSIYLKEKETSESHRKKKSS